MAREELTVAHAAMADMFKQPDAHSYGVYKLLEDLYPAFAKKLFEGNKFMKDLVTSGMNPMNILDYPICGRCETLAAGDGFGLKDKVLVKACSCLKPGCGARTLAPVTLRGWMVDELKNKAPADIAEVAEYIVDEVAYQMTAMAGRQAKKITEEYMKRTANSIGVTPDLAEDYNPEPQITFSSDEKEREFIEEMIKKENGGQGNG